MLDEALRDSVVAVIIIIVKRSVDNEIKGLENYVINHKRWQNVKCF